MEREARDKEDWGRVDRHYGRVRGHGRLKNYLLIFPRLFSFAFFISLVATIVLPLFPTFVLILIQ